MSNDSSVIDLVSVPFASEVQFLETETTEQSFPTQSQTATTSNPTNPLDTESPHLSSVVEGLSKTDTISATEAARNPDERLSSFSPPSLADSHSLTLVASPRSEQMFSNPTPPQPSPETALQNQPHVLDISFRPTSSFTPITPPSPFDSPAGDSEIGGTRPAILIHDSPSSSSPSLAESRQSTTTPPPVAWAPDNTPFLFESPAPYLHGTAPAIMHARTPIVYPQSHSLINSQPHPFSAPQSYPNPWQTPAVPPWSQPSQPHSWPTVLPMSTPNFSTPMAPVIPSMGLQQQNRPISPSPAVPGPPQPTRKKTNVFVAHSPFHRSSSPLKEDERIDGLTFDDIPMPGTYPVAPSTWDTSHAAVESGFPHPSTSQPPRPPQWQAQTMPPLSTSPWAANVSNPAEGSPYQRPFQSGGSTMPWSSAPPVPDAPGPLPWNYLSTPAFPMQPKSFWSRVLHWPFGRMSRPATPSPHVAFVVPNPNSTSSFNSFDSSVAKMGDFMVNTLPGQVYLHFLLRLPELYFTRVARIFEEADLTLPELREMALTTASQGTGKFDIQVAEPPNAPPQYRKLKSTWESFIDCVMREWKTFNIISVLLLSAILTILQIETAADDPVTRYTALFSLICALISLLFGCMYIIRFGSMRKTYKAAEWALEMKKTKSAIWWNVWVLLAMPAIWLTWSILLYIVCVMSFIWRANSQGMTPPPKVSHQGLLAVRIMISAVLGLGVVYGIMILGTFRHYGESMDKAWKRRIDEWVGEKAGYPSNPSDHPYPRLGTHPGSHLPQTPWGAPPPGLPTQGQYAPTLSQPWGQPVPQHQATANVYGNQEVPLSQHLNFPGLAAAHDADVFAEGSNRGPVLDPFQDHVVAATFKINPLLRPPEGGPNQVRLTWDLTLPTSTIHRSTDSSHISWSRGRDTPATFPRLTSLHLVSEAISWIISVKAHDEETGVTCGDVIEAIGNNLSKPANEAEFKALSSSDQREVSAAYYHCRFHSPGVPGGQLGEGLRRFDFLKKNRMYGGVETTMQRLGGEASPCVFVLRCSSQ